jgi:hypothetical protein
LKYEEKIKLEQGGGSVTFVANDGDEQANEEKLKGPK